MFIKAVIATTWASQFLLWNYNVSHSLISYVPPELTHNVMNHMRLFKTRQALYSIQNIITLYPREHAFGCKISTENRPNTTLCIVLGCWTVTLKTSSHIFHPISTVNCGNKIDIWKPWRHRLPNLNSLSSSSALQGCRDGDPDECGGTTLPSARQEAVRGGLPLRGHPGSAVIPGDWAGATGAGRLWRPDRLRSPHCQGLHLQHARYVCVTVYLKHALVFSPQTDMNRAAEVSWLIDQLIKRKLGANYLDSWVIV